MSEYQINTTEVIALKTFTKLIRAAETATAEAHRLLPESDLTISQFGVLETLLHLGPLCQKEIATKILKSTGNITQVIDNLENRKLVIRKRNHDDRRYYAIHLTEKGRCFIEDLFPEHAKRIAAAMSCLTQEEQQQLGKLCRKFKR